MQTWKWSVSQNANYVSLFISRKQPGEKCYWLALNITGLIYTMSSFSSSCIAPPILQVQLYSSVQVVLLTLKFFLFSLFTKMMFQKVSSEIMSSVYYYSSNPGQIFMDMFLGTLWSPPKNIPIEGLGEMPLENNGMQDNTSTFAQNCSCRNIIIKKLGFWKLYLCPSLFTLAVISYFRQNEFS